MIKLTFHTASVAQLPDILEPNSIDVILTDPPYEREFLPVYEDLARADIDPAIVETARQRIQEARNGR